MPIITIWKWKDLDENQLVEAMGATAILDYPWATRTSCSWMVPEV